MQKKIYYTYGIGSTLDIINEDIIALQSRFILLSGCPQTLDEVLAILSGYYSYNEYNLLSLLDNGDIMGKIAPKAYMNNFLAQNDNISFEVVEALSFPFFSKEERLLTRLNGCDAYFLFCKTRQQWFWSKTGNKFLKGGFNGNDDI